MSTTNQPVGAPQISPQVVRDVAQSAAGPGDFRERFSVEQPALDELIEEQLEPEGEVTIALARRLAAALWAMYVKTVDTPLAPLSEQKLGPFLPVARSLLDKVTAQHPGEDFDPEWLVELPRGAQPHLLGFLIGALRAARLNLPRESIHEAAVVLFAVAGALEGAAALAATDSDQW